MGNAAAEAPASYLMATQFYDQVRAMIDEMENERMAQQALTITAGTMMERERKRRGTDPPA